MNYPDSTGFLLLVWQVTLFALGFLGPLIAIVGLIMWLANRNFDSVSHNAKAWKTGRLIFGIGILFVVFSVVAGIITAISVTAIRQQALDQYEKEKQIQYSACAPILANASGINQKIWEMQSIINQGNMAEENIHKNLDAIGQSVKTEIASKIENSNSDFESSNELKGFVLNAEQSLMHLEDYVSSKQTQSMLDYFKSKDGLENSLSSLSKICKR